MLDLDAIEARYSGLRNGSIYCDANGDLYVEAHDVMSLIRELRASRNRDVLVRELCVTIHWADECHAAYDANEFFMVTKYKAGCEELDAMTDRANADIFKALAAVEDAYNED